MRRHRPRAGTDWERALASVRANRTEGARRLAIELLSALRQEGERWSGYPSRDRRIRVREIARELARTQPAMGLFGEWAREWRAIGSRSERSSPVRAVRAWAARWQRRLDREPGRLARVAAGRIPPRANLLTISRGETVKGVLLALTGSRRPREIVVLESRPGGEGRRLAAELRRRGLPARWIPDRNLPTILPVTDLVVVGADSVDTDGAVVNKVGTRDLARSARRAGVPLVVIAGRSKWIPRRTRSSQLPRLFDRTTAPLISEYWTDAGVKRGRRSRSAVRRPQRP